MMKKAGKATFLLLLLAMACVGVGMYAEIRGRAASEEDFAESTDSDPGTQQIQGFAGESAADAAIDFNALRKINPEIFAWIYIPDTAIDCPVLQSEQSDVYYESHNARREEDDAGAVYIELANLTSMCDFNTVLHGKTGGEADGVFADLYRFADPAFFEEHEYVYLYLDGNLLTYEIFAAYERENTSLIRTYDFTYLSGCRQFLSDLYGNRDREKNVRKGWEDVSAYHYIITLTTRKEENAKRQFVVVAVLVEDAAGVINRVVAE
ncbi:MAG: class B sortase [Lachnospiraceae bacterium]|nr:class B sortase [Lachnospiraceae bacterium]